MVNRLQQLLHDQLYAEGNADELAQRVLLNAHIGSLNFTVFRWSSTVLGGVEPHRRPTGRWSVPHRAVEPRLSGMLAS